MDEDEGLGWAMEDFYTYSLDDAYTNEIPKCPECKKKMKLDDIDADFKGCQDNYWVCPHCGKYSARQKIRYGKLVRQTIFSDDKVVSDKGFHISKK